MTQWILRIFTTTVVVFVQLLSCPNPFVLVITTGLQKSVFKIIIIIITIIIVLILERHENYTK